MAINKGNWLRKGRVMANHNTSRSFMGETKEGQLLRRNRCDLMPTKEQFTKPKTSIDDVLYHFEFEIVTGHIEFLKGQTKFNNS